jgi:NAD(P)-dependent dehydrogenase (short-subunit alcohol dehydrogenase family)
MRLMRTALITGTSTGIGEACAARLADHGWTVFAGVRRDGDGERLTARHRGDIRPVIFDVANRDHTRRVVADVAAAVGDGGLQALVSNAGVGVGGPVEYVSEADWRFVFDVNLFGAVALTQATIPLLRAGRGRIVYIGSIGGRLAAPGIAPYSASKFALEALSESMRHEFARSGTPIKVALVEPGAVRSEIWDKADATADDIERALDGEARTRYQWMIDEVRGFVDEGRANAVPADVVAGAVEHALTADRPKARYLVGPDAKIAGNVVARTPDRLRDALVQFVGKRYERRGRSRSGSRSA